MTPVCVRLAGREHPKGSLTRVGEQVLPAGGSVKLRTEGQ